jgi:CBS domain-containing protein
MATAKAIMSTKVITVAPDEDIQEAIHTMVLNNVTGLPVVRQDGTLAGVITEKDILELLCDEAAGKHRVEDVMTRDVVCFDMEADVAELAGAFRDNSFRRVPILEEGKLVGIVSRRDVIRHLRDHCPAGRIPEDSTAEIFY